jgi:predicted nucleic acid-binding protein
MIAVSNTTPLRYLIAIEQEQLFSGAFEKVFVPSAVHEELTKMATPERVRNVIRSLPSWYEVREVRSSRGTKFTFGSSPGNVASWRTTSHLTR